MKSPNIGTLTANEPVTALFLVLSKEIRQKKTGEPYLSLHLSDRTGEIEAKMWDNVAEVMDTFERDDFVKVKGLMQVYQNRAQFTIHRLRRLEEHEVDLADYFPASAREPEEMYAELRAHHRRHEQSASEGASRIGLQRCANSLALQDGARRQEHSSRLSQRPH